VSEQHRETATTIPNGMTLADPEGSKCEFLKGVICDAPLNRG